VIAAMAHKRLALAALAGFAACGVGLTLDARVMLRCYLAVWFAVTAIPVGALGVLLTSYLVRGGWTQDLHAPLTRAARTLPLGGALFVPVLIGLSATYPWADGTVALSPFQAVYLAPWFFILRTIAYVVIWSALALWAERAFDDPDARERAGAIGLIVWSLTVSFAGIDWLESIEPDFHSSTYGLLALSFALVAGLAFGLVTVLRTQPRQMANSAYAGLLLATLLLWAYLHAMQYIIIWTGNIPDEVRWYTDRAEGFWAVVLWVLFVGQFIMPFFALIFAPVRRSTTALFWLAIASLGLRVVEAGVLVLPPLRAGGLALALGMTAAMLAIGASLLLGWRVTGRDGLQRPVLRGAPSTPG
jgi:hypothetical protein